MSSTQSDERGLLEEAYAECDGTAASSHGGGGGVSKHNSHRMSFSRINRKTQKGFEKAGQKMLRGVRDLVGLQHMEEPHARGSRVRPDGFEELHSPQMMTRDEGGARKHLKIVVHEGSRLLAKNLNGYSDPYVTVSLAGQRAMTRVVMQSCNPKWEQALYLELPKLVDSKTDVLKVTVLDYDGPLVQSQFLGKFEVNAAQLWRNYREGDEPVSRHWYKLLGKKTSKRSERGELCMSLSFVDQAEIAKVSDMQRNAVAKCFSMQDDDLDLADWKLRVVVSEGRGFDSNSSSISQALAESSVDTFKYRISLRLGSCTYMTAYVTPKVHYIEDSVTPEKLKMEGGDDNLHSFPRWMKLGPGAQVNPSVKDRSSEESATGPGLEEPTAKRTGYLRYVWNQTFDIPLKEATKPLKMDAKLSNKLMTMGNLMGLDGLFWDTRENLSETEELRFIVQKTFKEEIADDDLSSQYYITGVGQYPLSGIYAFIDQATGENSTHEHCADAESRSDGESDTTEQATAGNAESSFSNSKSPPTKQRSMFSNAFKTIISHTTAATEVFPEETEVSNQREALEAGVATMGEQDGDGDLGISQHAWITLDGRGGQHAGELLVSFTFIKDPDSRKGVAPIGGIDFDSLLAGETIATEENAPEVEAMEMPPPLKDATVVDEVLQMPLLKLFHYLANPTSLFNTRKEQALQMREVENGEWLPDNGCIRKQKRTFIVKLPPNKLGPTEAYTESESDVTVLGRGGFVMHNTIRNPKITFGDTFILSSQIAATPCNATSCRIRISYSVEFVKSCIFKPAILKASLDGARNTAETELGLLKQIISGGEPADKETSEHLLRVGSASQIPAPSLLALLRQLVVLGWLIALLLLVVAMLLAAYLRAGNAVDQREQLLLLKQLLESLPDSEPASTPYSSDAPASVPSASPTAYDSSFLLPPAPPS